MINQLESGLSGEIFVDKNTAFVVEKYNPMDFVEKEIGDSKTPGKFLPQQKITRWDNECNVSVRLVHDEKTPDVVVEGDDVVWKGKKVEARFYDVFNTEHPEGAGEFEIVLKERPVTNVVEFTVQDKDVDYFYQAPLTAEEIAGGSERPENVEGSYAVYAKTPKTNYTGGKEYKTGKIGHIFRPQIEDANGSKVWGELNVDTENGILSVTIPQDFLDNAVYPVRHAAGLTFGYTSIGGTSGAPGAGKTVYGQSTPASSGNTSKFTMYVNWNFSGTSGNFTTALYNDTSNLPSSKIADAGTFTMVNGAAWKDATITQAVTGSTAYWFGIYAASSRYLYWWDTTGGVSNQDTSFTILPATASPGTNGTLNYSIYATYTATGVGNTGTHTDTGSGDTTAFDSGSTGSDRILVVGFSNYDTTSADRQVSTVTYGGSSLTKVTNSVADNATSNGRAEIWYLVAPATGSNNLVVTYAGANDVTNSDYFYTIFTGIDQTNPINTSDNHTTTGGTQDRITLTTTVDNCMLVDVNNGDAGGQTLGAGQTSLMDLGGSTGRGSFKQATAAGAYNMDMNTGSNDNYAHGAIALQPVGSGGGVVYIPRMGFIFHNHGIA